MVILSSTLFYLYLFFVWLYYFILSVFTQHLSLYSKLYCPTDGTIGILIGGSPSSVLLTDPKQALPEQLNMPAFTAFHLVAWSGVIEMVVYLKTQSAFPRKMSKR